MNPSKFLTKHRAKVDEIINILADEKFDVETWMNNLPEKDLVKTIALVYTLLGGLDIFSTDCGIIAASRKIDLNVPINWDMF